MALKIGRNLRKGENVHHINGDKTDNRIENLELWITNQPAGQRADDKVRHAIQIIKDHYDVAALLDDEIKDQLNLLILNLKGTKNG